MQINNISKYQNEVYGTSKHYKSDVEFKDILSQMLQSDSKSNSVDSVDTFRDNIDEEKYAENFVYDPIKKKYK